MRARTEPSTTGFTISRCEGLNARLRWTGPPGVVTSELKPWWYLTSPLGRSSGAVWSNSANRSAGILPSELTSTLRRPRWAMPITISCTPLAPAWLISSSIETMKLSPPSSEKRFWPTYLVCRKRSRPSAAVRRLSTCFFCSALSLGLVRALSSRCCHQRLWFWSVVYMYSAPMVPQYVSRSALSRSRKDMVSLPKKVLLVLNTVSRSASVKP